MKRVVIALLVSVMLVGTAYAQQSFPAMDVAEMVKDSVVSIDANRVVYGATRATMMGDLASYTRLSTSFLSGFIYTENGYIITDSQDIEDATILTIWLGDGTELEAEVVGVDEDYGIGVIKVDTDEPLTPVKLVEGTYDHFEDIYPYDQGDPVVAIGYSGGLGGTVTFGIISAIRNMRNRNRILIPNVIQSDVAINSGNEGCALFNEKGEVVGLHDRAAAGMQNTTFFTPIWLVKRIADELITIYETNSEEQVWHPWLGIKPYAGSTNPFTGRIRTVGDDLKMYMNIPDQYWDVGILLDNVWMESPAREYGLMDQDMLLDVTVLDADLVVKHEYQLLTNISDLEILVTTADRDETFVFGVLRNFKYFKVEVVIGQHPGAFSFVSGSNLAIEDSSEYF